MSGTLFLGARFLLSRDGLELWFMEVGSSGGFAHECPWGMSSLQSPSLPIQDQISLGVQASVR